MLPIMRTLPKTQGGSSMVLLWDRSSAFSDVSSLLTELKACTSSRNLERGKCLHQAAIERGDDCNVRVASSLINMYAKCRSMDDARRVFDNMRYRDAVTWTVLMLGYADNGQGSVALELFSRMRREGCPPDSRSLVAALKACSDIAAKNKINETCRIRGMVLHLLALRLGCDSDLFVGNTFVNMYAGFGDLDHACRVFENMQIRDVVSWNALILGYAGNGKGSAALDIFSKMRLEGCVPNARTFVAAFKASMDATLREGSVMTCRERVLSLLASCNGCDTDVFVGNTLVDMYAKGGNMEDARGAFERMECRDMITWTSLVLGYVKSLKVDSSFKEVDEDQLIEDPLFKHANSKSLDGVDDALKVFEKMPSRDVVCWTALIVAYADNGDGALALKLYARMKLEGFAPDARTSAAALKACATVGAFQFGKRIHSELCEQSLKHDVMLATCLVDFYAKCGSLAEAQEVFDSSCRSKDVIAWNALLAGYGRHGDTEAFALFERLMDANLKPNRITFLCVLTTCSHAGLVEKGIEYFKMMRTKYGIEPDLEHYTCLIDLLGRAKKLDEAMLMLRNMHCTPNDVTWTALLGACRKWKNVDLGRLAFESLLGLDEDDMGAYVLMTNLYGSKGMWEDQAALQAQRMKLRIWKKPGKSWWTNQVGEVHSFLAGNMKIHPQSREIHEKLSSLGIELKKHGYVADLTSITRKMPDFAKEDALCGHSEKLAIACALINTGPGEAIRIMKNLRVCSDCHTATALISKVESRTIICRDASRFHVFIDGKCSCGDFW